MKGQCILAAAAVMLAVALAGCQATPGSGGIVSPGVSVDGGRPAGPPPGHCPPGHRKKGWC